MRNLKAIKISLHQSLLQSAAFKSYIEAQNVLQQLHVMLKINTRASKKHPHIVLKNDPFSLFALKSERLQGFKQLLQEWPLIKITKFRQLLN